LGGGRGRGREGGGGRKGNFATPDIIFGKKRKEKRGEEERKARR